MSIRLLIMIHTYNFTIRYIYSKSICTNIKICLSTRCLSRHTNHSKNRNKIVYYHSDICKTVTTERCKINTRWQKFFYYYNIRWTIEWEWSMQYIYHMKPYFSFCPIIFLDFILITFSMYQKYSPSSTSSIGLNYKTISFYRFQWKILQILLCSKSYICLCEWNTSTW